MNLHTFFHELCTLELSDLIFGDENVGESPTLAMRHKLTPILNSCLRQMYIDYQIEQKELVLRTDSNIRRYFLRKEHATQDPSPEDKYIIDSHTEPFMGDVARVDEVLDEEGRLVFSSNQNILGGNVRRPSWDSLSFHEPRDNLEYLVRYRASAPVFTEADSDAQSDTQIKLPPGFLDLLRFQIADRVYSSQKTEESIAKGQQYRLEASALSAILVGQGTAGEEGWDLGKTFYRRGFI